MHVLYTAVLPSFFVRTRTDQVARRDPTKTDYSIIGATIFRLLQVTSIVLTEAADLCLIPADFFVVNAGQGPWQRVWVVSGLPQLAGEVALGNKLQVAAIKSTAGEV